MPPAGKMPPWSEMRWNPVSEPVGEPKMTKQMPTIRKITSAATLIRENQNSISPKTFTEIMLVTTTSTTTARATAHCGIAATKALYWPNQCT